jgi:hypothetical protein
MRRVHKLTSACLLVLAAISLDCRDVRSQELSPRDAPGTSAAPGASASNPSRAASATPSTAPSVAEARGAGRSPFFAPHRLDEGLTTRRVAVEGVDTRTSSGSLLDVGALASGDEQQPSQQTQPQAQPYTPLSSDAKMKRAFRNAFLNPEGYARSAIAAAITEWGEDDLPHKTTEDRVADGLSRFAIKFSTRATRTLLGSGVYASLFKQDPRYERSKSKNVGRRALHAMSRVFVTRGDNGRLQPNYSRWAGSLSASALSNLWQQSTPGHDRIGVDATFRRFGTSFITDAWQTAVFAEFLPDILKIFKR